MNGDSSAHPRSEEFARDLDTFLASAIGPAGGLSAVEVGDGLRIGPSPLQGGKFSLISLTGSVPGPCLKVEYKLADDASGEFCRVLESTFGLYVPLDKPGSHAPVIRVEYVGTQSPPAHVHLHASSAPLGWIYGTAGGGYRRSEQLHFPVGSKRFRPTIEEFLLFLHDERLFRNWSSGVDWVHQASERIVAYERRQAMATVRHYPDEIAEEMRRLGWTVTAPVEPRRA